MKGMLKVLSRYVATAATVAVLLLILNVIVAFVWITGTYDSGKTQGNVAEIAKHLTKNNGGLSFTEQGREQLEQQFEWAMLLDQSGEVIWSEHLPQNMARKYTNSEVAGFSRWYLAGYPVYVWQHPEGLFVLGAPKDSVWKKNMEMPQHVVKQLPEWMLGVLIANIGAALLLALLFGLRLFRSLRSIANGIEDIANNKEVQLPIRGVLGDLAQGLNKTSARLKQQEAALQRRDDARTTWIAGVSHDIRTPLSIVMGYASQLEENSNLPSQEQEQVRIIRSQTEKIKTLVSDLNLVSKLEYDMQPLHLTTLSPAAIVRGIVVDFLNSSLNHSYTIEIDVKPDAGRIQLIADEKLLQRAIENLVSNSIRHNPDGCHIIVAVHQEDATCQITIADSGIGFSTLQLEMLNSPPDLVQLDSHGLGLTLVRQIMKAHQGTVAFYNFADGGCGVTLELPIHKEDVATL
ncbi:signal transduction histidine kinase [Paenibacillus turicensis]|uniref:histidine kinase n=1 Tax=Paenibacillus turicensis TaxID=160487 RepID=A0ABS4FX47_9BACL|nr:HAMP domain-containing sensor histidine kinase [Paenibacillus turicensis]MBP1907156.1 signal transduction histidine kinase [Paenibacillus turicensis]